MDNDRRGASDQRFEERRILPGLAAFGRKAPGGQVFRLMMRAGQRLAIVGIVLGLAAAYAGGRLATSAVYAMPAADPMVLLAATAIVGAATLLTTMIPAVRASRTDPMRALRSE